MERPIRTLYWFSLCTTLLALAGCGKRPDVPFYRQGLVYCSESNPITFNPQLDTSSTTADASSHQLYNRLITFDPDNGRILPDLASSWSVSADGLTYVFQLRKGVNFHTTDYFSPSRTFNADDVLFSIDRWRRPNHPYHDVSGGRYPYFDSLGLAVNIASVRRVNGYRVEIKLHQRDSAFLANLASDFAVILSKEYGERLLAHNTPQHIDEYPIGTGPFKFEKFRKDHYIRFQRNSDYWKPVESAELLIFDITPRSSLRLAKLMTGECDAMALPAQTELSVIRQQDDLVLEEKPGLNVGYWAFNTRKPPFDNPDVRRAMAFAIDKNTLLEAVYFNGATRAKTLLPDSSWAHQRDADDTAYNPVLARKLLDDAGVPRGMTMTIWAMPVERSYNPNALKMAELIQQYLAAIEVNVEIVTFDWNTFRQRLNEGQHDTVLIGWSADNADPDNFYRPLLSCDAIPSRTNRAMWCNDYFDTLLDEALQTDDIERRKMLYFQANRLLYEQLPIMPIAHAYHYQAQRSDITGLTINPYGGVVFSGVTKSND